MCFLGEGHDKNERRTWAVIWLCGTMMIAEIVGGVLFGSIALVADGLHMSTHAGALLLAALAYTYARKRSALSGPALLWAAPDGGMAGNPRPSRQPQAGAAPDAAVGTGGGRPASEYEQAG